MNIKEYYQMLLINNAEFREFVKSCEGKSYQQVAMENDIDITALEQTGQQAI